MIISNVTIQRMEVESFAIGKGVDAKIFFNDGNNKAILVHSDLVDIEGDAHRAITRIRNYEKDLSMKLNNHQDFLDGFVNIVINEEDKAEERVKIFFRKISEKTHQLRGSRMAMGYLDLINQVKNIKVEF